MSVNLNIASQIFKLCDTKEYVLTAKPILDSLATDYRLTSLSGQLWQYLYGKARYNHDLSIKISYLSLSTAFHKSIRTITRWVSSLNRAGYLRIEKNFKPNYGGQTVNTFFLTIPEEVLRYAKSLKDRKQKKSTRGEKALFSQRPAPPPPDKSVTGGGDNIVTLNNILKDNTNNNTPVVSPDLKMLEEKELVLSKQRNIENKVFEKILNEVSTGSKSYEEYNNQRDKLSKIESGLIFLRNEKEKLSQSIKINQKTAPIKQEIEFMKKARGNRAMPEFTYKRLVKGLSELGYKDTDLIQLVNETTFAIRFGSLRDTKDKTPMGMEKGVNIALKLVREGRWDTPAEMKRFCEEV